MCECVRIHDCMSKYENACVCVCVCMRVLINLLKLERKVVI